MVLTLIMGVKALSAENPDGANVEKWPNGKTKVQATYRGGKLEGAYSEYFEDGKVKIRATYRNGELNGPRQEFRADGSQYLMTTYADGKRNGKSTEMAADGRSVRIEMDFVNGALKQINGKEAYPISREALEAELKNLQKAQPFQGDIYDEAPSSTLPLKAGKLKTAYQEEALAYVQAYRFLAGVPYKNLKLNPEFSKLAQHIAVYCQYEFNIKKWPPPNPHEPPALPGVDDAFYKLAKAGGRSNIYDHWDDKNNLKLGVLDWMRDANEYNLPNLGHRRHLLNPSIDQCGFGECGRMDALYFESLSREPYRYDFIAYPPRGYLPASYFEKTWPWSVTLNPATYKVDSIKVDTIDIKIYELNEHFEKIGDPLELNHKAISKLAYGIPNCIIFRPSKLELSDGKRYQVEISIDPKDRNARPVSYVVEFVKDK